MKTRCILLLATCSLFLLSLAQPTSSFATFVPGGAAAEVLSPIGQQSNPSPEASLTARDLLMYALAFLLVVYEWAVRVFPTVASYSVLTWVARLIAWLVPDRYKKPATPTIDPLKGAKWSGAKEMTHLS